MIKTCIGVYVGTSGQSQNPVFLVTSRIVPRGEMKDPTGAVSKYTNKRVMIILSAVRSGQTMQMACGKARVAVSTVRKWLHDPEKGEFREGFNMAMVQAEENLVKVLYEHAETHPATAKWLLTKRHAHWRDPLDESLKQARLQKELMELEVAKVRLEKMRSETTIDLMDVLGHAKPKRLEKQSEENENEEGSQGSSKAHAKQAGGPRHEQGGWYQRKPHDETTRASEEEAEEKDEDDGDEGKTP
jgi:hypothetical protein